MSLHHRHVNGVVSQDGACFSCNITKAFGGEPTTERVYVLSAAELAEVAHPSPSVSDSEARAMRDALKRLDRQAGR